MDDQQVTIETPEHVTLSYEVAGPSSRMVAALLDHLIIALAVLALLLIALSLGFTAAGATAIGIIAGGPLLFLVVYFTTFELLWNGQTPGKRTAGLRVMRDDGTPASALDVIIRNTVRLVDFLPYLYFVGGAVSFFQKHSKRLGDLAAGTVVVKLRESALPDVHGPSPAAADHPDELAPLVRSTAFRITPAELAGIRRFLDRRFELAPDVRVRLARDMARAIEDKLSPEAIALGEERPEAFLEAIARACAEMGERF